jgi:hypothetical protein
VVAFRVQVTAGKYGDAGITSLEDLSFLQPGPNKTLHSRGKHHLVVQPSCDNPLRHVSIGTARRSWTPSICPVPSYSSLYTADMQQSTSVNIRSLVWSRRKLRYLFMTNLHRTSSEPRRLSQTSGIYRAHYKVLGSLLACLGR